MPQDRCRRCGSCCTKGGPALHLQDAPLLSTGSLAPRDLVCFRQGELAHNPRQEKLLPVAQEILKIRGHYPSWSCMYFDPQTCGCLIYAHRPVECQALSCLDPQDLFEVMDTPYLSRWDLLDRSSALGVCIAEHEARFPVPQAMAWARDWLTGPVGSTQEQLYTMVRYEWDFRQVFAAKVQTTDEDLWAYFGRPLWLVLSPLVPDLRIWLRL